MSDDQILHLIFYMRRMMEQMMKFLDDAERGIEENKRKIDVHKSDPGSWP